MYPDQNYFVYVFLYENNSIKDILYIVMITCGKIINMWTLFEKRNKWGTDTVFFAPARLVLYRFD